jgi:hypothetical protein
MTFFDRTTFAAVATAALVATTSAHAGIVVSNVDEYSEQDVFNQAGAWFSDTVWLATSFTTDAEAYTLTTISVTLGQQAVAGPVVPRIFLDDSGGPSGNALETFGSQTIDSLQGVYTFTSTGLPLDPNTTYWLALQAQGSPDDIFFWFATASTNQSGVWTIGNDMIESTNSGSTWPTSNAFVGLLSISATPVPEPSPLVLTLAGLVCAAAWHRWLKVSFST